MLSTVRKVMMRAILFGLLIVAIPLTANAASFACAHPREADEKAICADRNLNDLDVELMVRLDIAKKLAAPAGRSTLSDDQRAWLMARKACGGDKSCLIRRYDDRMEEVKGVLEKFYRKGPK